MELLGYQNGATGLSCGASVELLDKPYGETKYSRKMACSAERKKQLLFAFVLTGYVKGSAIDVRSTIRPKHF